jgi:hypothetical protein
MKLFSLKYRKMDVTIYVFMMYNSINIKLLGLPNEGKNGSSLLVLSTHSIEDSNTISHFISCDESIF